MVDAVARYKFRDGTRSLLEAMVADGKPEVRLSTPVARVEHEAEKVVVTTQGGESFSSRAAVVTVPLNVLANIDFSRPLSPGKQAASRERQASHGVKSWALVRGAQKDFFGIAPDPSPLTWIQSEYEVPDGTLLVGFGPDANLLDVKNPQAVQHAVRQFLPKAEVLGAGGHNWEADPYSRGTWPVFRPRQLTRYLKELQRTEGRLIFAGSETANGWNGFIDGAIETGLRAGREVVQLLGSSRPQ
jgi:monoamine oxidase